MCNLCYIDIGNPNIGVRNKKMVVIHKQRWNKSNKGCFARTWVVLYDVIGLRKLFENPPMQEQWLKIYRVYFCPIVELFITIKKWFPWCINLSKHWLFAFYSNTKGIAIIVLYEVLLKVLYKNRMRRAKGRLGNVCLFVYCILILFIQSTNLQLF